jgi:glycosyltransferase involved in cell wall biosynthesis
VRLCYVANPNSIHVRRWVRYFSTRGHEVHLISTRPVQSSVPPGVILHPVSALPTPMLRNLALGYAVRKQVRAIRPDLLHAHQISPDGWQAAMAGFHPLLLTAWGSDLLLAPHRAWRYRLFIRWALARADYVTCVSENLAQAARALGADPSRLELAPWGVETEVFCPGPSSDALRAKLGLGQGPVVLSIRALRSLYHPLDFAQAIPGVLEQVPDTQFIIRSHLYDPELLSQVQAIIDEHNIAGKVRFVGDLADDPAIADLYRLADVAVSVPSSDGTPQSVLEAIACGAALVLSDVPSLHEWVRDGREGLFVPVGDVGAIASAIVRLLKDASLRSELQANGLELIRQRADSRVWMAHAEAIYEWVRGCDE